LKCGGSSETSILEVGIEVDDVRVRENIDSNKVRICKSRTSRKRLFQSEGFVSFRRGGRYGQGFGRPYHPHTEQAAGKNQKQKTATGAQNDIHGKFTPIKTPAAAPATAGNSAQLITGTLPLVLG
jgi:hypothetical protein